VPKIEIENCWYKNQQKIFKATNRFIVAACGRRFGKTEGAVMGLCEKALHKPNTLNWWLAPTYSQSKIALEYFLRLYSAKKIITKFNKAELKLTLIGGSHGTGRKDHLDCARAIGMAAAV